MNTSHTRLLSTASIFALCALPLQAQEIFDLGEVSVSAASAPIAQNRSGSSVEILDQESIDASETSRLSETLERLPGVSITQVGPTGTTGDLTIRGSSERYTAVYIDGIKVNDPTVTSGQFANFGTIGNFNLSRVEVLKGSQSALYGGSAVAGVVNIFTLPDADTPDGFSQRAEVTFGSFGTYSGSYDLVQKQDRLTLNFGISRFESDGFSAADEDNGNTEDDSFRENRLNFGAAYQLTDIWLVGINGFVTDAASEFDEFASAPVDGTPDEKATRDSKGLRLYAESNGDIWDQTIALTYFRVDRTLVSPTVGAETAAAFGSPFESDFKGERVRLEYAGTTQVSESVLLTLGGDFQRETGEYDNLTSGSEDVDIYGLFAEAVYSPRNDVDVIATLRRDDHSTFGGETTGRLAFSWRPTQQLTLRGAVANGYRAPTIDELFGNYPGAFPFAGNPDLTPETSESFELGADYAFASGAVISATAFLTEIDDFITFEFATPTSSLVNVPGVSKRQGIELSGSVPLAAGVELFGSYTYTDAKDATGARLIRVPKHDIFAGLSAEVTDALTTQLFVTYVADRPEERSQLMDNYTVVSASVSYDITDATQAFVRFDNIFDEDYQTVAGYGTAGRSVFAGVRASF